MHEFGNLIIKTISPEDIISLKCATEREKDRNDAASLIEKFNIDWEVIIKESIHQTEKVCCENRKWFSTVVYLCVLSRGRSDE